MKEGQGSLFKNTKKNSPNQPDSYGSIMINVKEWRLSGWTKQGKTDKFISLQLSEPREQRQQEDDSQGTGDLPF